MMEIYALLPINPQQLTSVQLYKDCQRNILILRYKLLALLDPRYRIYVVPPQSWGDRSGTKHSKCLLLGGRRLNRLTVIPKPKGSGSARAATAQIGPANKRNETKRCLPVEASLRPGEAVPW